MTDEKPSKERLKKIVKSLQKKYGIKIRVFRQKGDLLFCSLEIERGTLTTLCCNSFDEFMCKYILLCKNEVEMRKAVCQTTQYTATVLVRVFQARSVMLLSVSLDLLQAFR